jgi:valyl-tRNA synthetase
VNEEAERAGERLVEILNSVREIKSNNKVSIKHPIDLTICYSNEKEKTLTETILIDLKNVTSANKIDFSSEDFSEGEGINILVNLSEKTEVA